MPKKDAAAAADRRARKKEELARALVAQQTIKKMEEVAATDILAGLPSFRTYARAGLDLTLVSVASAAALPPAAADALFDLTATNMAGLYQSAGFGWDPAAKRRELGDGDARFLLAYASADIEGGGNPPVPSTALPLAFVHYRFTLEAPGPLPTLYVYEIQLGPSVRRKGLGRFLMLALELAARKGGIGQLMLTVQAGNEGASALYAGLGFTPDPASPGPGEGPGGTDSGYTILSKQLPAVGTGGGGVARGDAAATVVSGGGGGGVAAKAGGGGGGGGAVREPAAAV